MRVDSHALSADTNIEDTLAWLRQHGYRGVAAGGVGRGTALLFSRRNEPVQMAVIGDVLVYWKHLDVVEVEG